MKNYLKVLIACILGALLFSACNTASPADQDIVAENDALIKEITASYLTEISCGAFANELYNSKFSPSLVISDLTFNQPQAQGLMNECMTQMTFEIYGVKPAAASFSDSFDKHIKADCLVEISVIDIENTLIKVNNPLLGYVDLIKILPESDKISFTKKNIALELAYNEERAKWEIMDNSQLMKLIIEPFKRMTLDNPAGRPDAIMDEFIQSVRSVDTEKIVELTDGYSQYVQSDSFERFFYENKINLEDAKKIFPYIKIEIVPDFSLLPDDATYYGKYLAKIPIRVFFPNIGDTLKSLDHKATIEEIVSLLEKSDDSNRLIFEEQILELWVDPDTQVWYVTDYGNFKSIAQEVWSYVYSYPSLPDPSETANQYMMYLVRGELNSINSLSMEAFPSWYKGSEFGLKDSSTYSNSQFVKELLSDCDYKLISMEKSPSDQQMYMAKYSVSLPDLHLLLDRIASDQETLVPLLKPILNEYLAAKAVSDNQYMTSEEQGSAAEEAFFRSYVDHVKNLIKNEIFPLKEYQIEISIKPFVNGSSSSWYVYDFSLIEPDVAGRFIGFFSNSCFIGVAHEVKNQILSEGVYTQNEFASLCLTERWTNLI